MNASSKTAILAARQYCGIPADIPGGYSANMFDVAAPLMNALGAARGGLTAAAADASRAATPYGSPRVDASMADVAERAIFTEALLGAIHSRLAEIKSVTRA